MKADLHIHTTASDGRLSPLEIVQLAVRLELDVIAITDHDSIEGIAPALAAAPSSLTVIPGVEINTDVSHGEVHILGYFIDYTAPELCATLEKMRNSRKERALKMIAKLESLGMSIDWEHVWELAQGGSVGRPHIAQALLDKGYITSMKEAFAKYIGHGAPAYVERDKTTPVEAVRLIASAHGLPVLAHPADINNLDGLIVELKVAGLVGIEVYYNGYNSGIIDELLAVANDYKLIVTGGSDFHELECNSETVLGGVDISAEAVEKLFALAGESLELMSS